MNELNLEIAKLRALYINGTTTPTKVMEQILSRCVDFDSYNIWITLLDQDQLCEMARKVEARGIESQPLFGIPFAIMTRLAFWRRQTLVMRVENISYGSRGGAVANDVAERLGAKELGGRAVASLPGYGAATARG